MVLKPNAYWQGFKGIKASGENAVRGDVLSHAVLGTMALPSASCTPCSSGALVGDTMWAAS